MYEEEVRKLQDIIDDSQNIVFFGGAGVSTESNIPDFRSADGLYQQQYKYSPEQIVSHSFFVRNTEAFYEFYKSKMMFLDAKPNPAHKKLAELEAAGKLSAVITQNIDGLHQKAGSKKVYEIHGSTLRNYCDRCHKRYPSDYIFRSKEPVPRCTEPGCTGIVRPDVTLYGEMLPEDAWRNAERACREADMMIVGGTSLSVYPAASLLDYFSGRYLVLINRDRTVRDGDADLVFHDSIGKVLSHCGN